jgi:PKD repeat protein
MKTNFYSQVVIIILCCLSIFSCKENNNLDQNPVVDFTTKIEGYKVQFANLSENGITYHWDFGDGTESTLKDPEHVYAIAGKFNVVLTVDNASGSNKLTKEVEIVELFLGDRITIDGKFNDWSKIDSFKPKADDAYLGLQLLKVASNQQFIFIYGKVNKDIFATAWISIFFDYDLSNTTGYKPWFADGGFESFAQSTMELRDGALFFYTGNPGEANWSWDQLASNGTGFNLWGEPKEGGSSYEFEYSLDKTKILGLGKKTVGISAYLEKDWVTQGLIPSNGSKSILLNLETGIATKQN